MDISSRYQQLNAAQQQAVDTIDGPVMVVAGPGTGKTELLSVRIARILQKTDTSTDNILCLTFTESGAAAMRERLIGLIGKDAYKVSIHTFHSFGTEIINQYREYFYNGALFQPADDLTRYEILRTIFDELEYNNPLASTMNGEYTHQSDAAQVISELKRSGLTSDELRTILDSNELAVDTVERHIVPIFTDRIGKATAAQLTKVLHELHDAANAAETLFEIPPLLRTIYDSLVAAVEETESVHPTKPLTAWKKQWLAKDKVGELRFKSRGHIKKLRALAFVYYEYLRRMEEAGLFDYDDMILQVVHALEVHDDLRYQLQEKYLYMMVDEFQDTNVAQMRILHSLTSNPVNEGLPNIMVVGDDDQAIYSFQGADISNILRFRELYPATTLVTLTDNYRSNESILSESRSVIVQGGERLEQVIPELDKTLTAHSNASGSVELREASSSTEERNWLIEDIQKAIAAGVNPGDIAVLTRRHNEIGALLPYFFKVGLTVKYERQDNALDEPPIAALELLARVVNGLASGRHDDVNGLLPELLAHPAWGVTPPELWRLSSDAYDARKRWMDMMETSQRFVSIYTWLLELAQASQTESLEVLLDRMIGRAHDDTEDAFKSPFYEYYFSDIALTANPAQYLEYLTALQTIRSHLREYSQDDTPTLDSYIGFVALHRRLGTRISITRYVAEGEESAINIMTAHKSKGLEFERVYILNATDSVWGEKVRNRSRTIGYPENLPLANAGSSADERLRLFYVAMTRAKASLIMSYSIQDDNGRSTLLASFLSEKPATSIDSVATLDRRVEAAELAWFAPFSQPTQELETLLRPQLAKYKLSATHLNHFLDVSRGGPRSFLLDNLLHFPSAKPAAAAYGSAIHAALQQAHLHLASKGERKPVEDVLHDFEIHLKKERLSTNDFQQYLQKGSDQLSAYLNEYYEDFAPSQKAELNFSHQAAYVDDAHLTGMLDVADCDPKEKTMIVTDYKTGKPVTAQIARTDYEKIKLHKYSQQLLFYKLLVEHSRDYSNYTVTNGRLAFIEPTAAGTIVVEEVSYDKEELDRFRRLIGKVWEHIITLNLPDVSEYPQTYQGMLDFEEDLLNDRV